MRNLLLLAALVPAACAVQTGSDSMTFGGYAGDRLIFQAAKFSVRDSPGADRAAWRKDLEPRLAGRVATQLTFENGYRVVFATAPLCAPVDFPLDEKFGTQGVLEFDGSYDVARVPVNGWTSACFFPARAPAPADKEPVKPSFMLYTAADAAGTAALVRRLRDGQKGLLEAKPELRGGRTVAEMFPEQETRMGKTALTITRYVDFPGTDGGRVQADYLLYTLPKSGQSGGIGVIYPERRKAEAHQAALLAIGQLSFQDAR